MTVKAGDSILIVAPFLDCGMYRAGDVLEVDKTFKGCVLAKGIENVIGQDEYVPLERGELNGGSKLHRLPSLVGSSRKIG